MERKRSNANAAKIDAEISTMNTVLIYLNVEANVIHTDENEKQGYIYE